MSKRARTALTGGLTLIAAQLPGPAVAASVEAFGEPSKTWRASSTVRLERPSRSGNRFLQARVRGRPGTLARSLRARGWRLSFDFALDPRSAVAIGLGDGRHVLEVKRRGRGSLVTAAGARGRPRRLDGSAGPAGRRWIHVQAVSLRRAVEVSIGGRRFRLPRRAGTRLSVWIGRGTVRLDDVIVSRKGDRTGLVLHRLANLNARVPQRRFVVGADRNDRLRLRSRFWTRGYLAGALWRASALVPGTGPFEDAAFARTVANLGYEEADSHDVGLIYEHSSLAALRLACRGAVPARRQAPCARFARSAHSAARSLLALASTNPGGGTIPTRTGAPSYWESDTIIDSLMNLPLLYWASEATGDPRFREVAARHARRVMELHLRPDGSTFQSVHMERLTGRVLLKHTHQGVSADSTWSRGQGWAVYGFAASAAALSDRELTGAAERAARWVANRLPASGIPPYDYDAPGAGPPDVSAAVITAAGLLRLAELCRDQPGACAEPDRWRPLADRMLTSALSGASERLPLGFLGDQVGTYGGAVEWDDRAELIYGLNYGLEAVARSRGRSALP